MRNDSFIPSEKYTYHTIPETMEILKIGRSTVEKYINKGFLKSIKFGGTRRVIFTKADFKEQEMNSNYEQLLKGVHNA